MIEIIMMMIMGLAVLPVALRSDQNHRRIDRLEKEFNELKSLIEPSSH